jgi:hypothetical protein
MNATLFFDRYSPKWKIFYIEDKMAGKRWTQEEKDTVKQFYLQGLKYKQISKLTNRTPKAIFHQIKKHFQISKNYSLVYPGFICNKLTVLRLATTNTRQGDIWLVKCQCGNYAQIDAYRLFNKKIISCNKCKMNKFKSGYNNISAAFMRNIKNGAKKRNIEFNITIQYIDKLFIEQNKKCSLTGQDLIIIQGKSNKNTTASLDRIDSSKGYVEGNVQFVHKYINVMKWDLSTDEFINICQMVVNYNKDKNE